MKTRYYSNGIAKDTFTSYYKLIIKEKEINYNQVMWFFKSDMKIKIKVIQILIMRQCRHWYNSKLSLMHSNYHYHIGGFSHKKYEILSIWSTKTIRYLLYYKHG